MVRVKGTLLKTTLTPRQALKEMGLCANGFSDEELMGGDFDEIIWDSERDHQLRFELIGDVVYKVIEFSSTEDLYMREMVIEGDKFHFDFIFYDGGTYWHEVFEKLLKDEDND